jgi:S1-C subfamily serine protease
MTQDAPQTNKLDELSARLQRVTDSLSGNRLAEEALSPQVVEGLKRASVQVQNYRINSPANGSGFIVSDHEVVTNLHVVGNTKTLEVLTPSGETFPARVVRVDEANDLAFLDVQGLQAGPDQQAKLGSSKALADGAKVLTAGHPLGQTEVKITEGRLIARNSFADSLDTRELASAVGNVRDYYRQVPHYDEALAKYLASPRLESSAAIEHGNSGGILANSKGEVVGVTTDIDTHNPGRSFSVPVENVRNLLSDTRETYKFDYKWSSNIENNPLLYGSKDAALVGLAAKLPRFAMPAVGLMYGKDFLDAAGHLSANDSYGNRNKYWREAAADSAAVVGGVLSLTARLKPVGYALVGARIGMEVVQDFWRDKPQLKSVARIENHNPGASNRPGRTAEPFFWSAFDEPRSMPKSETVIVRSLEIGGIMRGR